MQRIYIKAFNALKKLGVPVYENDFGTISISAEAVNASDWVDYYNESPDWEFGVNPQVEKVLRANRLYAEWVNPGYLNVYPS